MAEQPEPSKALLLAEISSAWADLTGALDNLTEAQITGIKDEQGWTVKDHLTHMAAWEQSMLNLLQGKPRHEALDVSRELYLNGGDDAINAVVRDARKDLTVEQARSQLEETNTRLVALVESLSDEDLRQPDSHFLAEGADPSDKAPVLYRLYGNSAGHFKEHLGWIRSLVVSK